MLYNYNVTVTIYSNKTLFYILYPIHFCLKKCVYYTDKISRYYIAIWHNRTSVL